MSICRRVFEEAVKTHLEVSFERKSLNNDKIFKQI